MKVFVIGLDGYIGWALKQYLTERGHNVSGIDNFSRETNVKAVGSESLYPVGERTVRFGDVLDYGSLCYLLRTLKPDAIVHLGEQPSAPYSMIDRDHAFSTQRNNVLGTLNLIWAVKECCPDAHIVKLGTMGEYGTPNVDIPEGFFEVEYNGRKDTLPFPKQPHSFYHLSKVHDSNNLMMASKWWNLRVTDLNQGIVYGHINKTRFDYDQYFGTIINRFIAQALIGYPLTVYGTGGQRRGFINLKDTMRCIELAMQNPPEGYRVFNQFTETFSVLEIANLVSMLTKTSIQFIANPRMEKEGHHYKAANSGLLALGLEPQVLAKELPILWETMQPYKSRVRPMVITPTTTWRK